jgi:hypothetical protein
VSDTLGRYGLTVESRRYAVKELARRAGVSRELANRWRIEIDDRETSIYVQPGSQRRISIPVWPIADWRYFANDRAHVAHAGWMRPPVDRVAALVPDFILPFSTDEGGEMRPLFNAGDRDSVACSQDVLRSMVLTLSRCEEMVSQKRDVHDRFEASASVAARQGFLHRPIVDEYGFAFAQALSHLLPGWKPDERIMRVKLSHDADLVGLPFSFSASVGHTVRRHKPWATIQDFLSLTSVVEPAYLQLVREVVAMAAQHGLNSAVYWQASAPSAFDTGYDPRHPKVRRVLAWLLEHNVELGVHPSYASFRSVDRLREEVSVLRDVLGTGKVGGRQHYLRWCPDSWADWEACGLAYDSTVGYADQIGFRAGTCIPYRPWLMRSNREANLLEIPLLVMDETLIGYMDLQTQHSLRAVTDMIARCRVVGGVFTLLWHNSSLLEPAFDDLYAKLLDSLAGTPTYDWESDLI